MRRFSMTVPIVAFDGFDQRRDARDRRHFGEGAQLEREVDARGLLHLQLDVAASPF